MRPPVVADPGAKPKAKRRASAVDSDEEAKPKRKYKPRATAGNPQPVMGGGFLGMVGGPGDDVGLMAAERRIKASQQQGFELGMQHSAMGWPGSM